jgi:hypothetical protein
VSQGLRAFVRMELSRGLLGCPPVRVFRRRSPPGWRCFTRHFEVVRVRVVPEEPASRDPNVLRHARRYFRVQEVSQESAGVHSRFCAFVGHSHFYCSLFQASANPRNHSKVPSARPGILCPKAPVLPCLDQLFAHRLVHLDFSIRFALSISAACTSCHPSSDHPAFRIRASIPSSVAAVQRRTALNASTARDWSVSPGSCASLSSSRAALRRARTIGDDFIPCFQFPTRVGTKSRRAPSLTSG